jgi:hypothetical protein
VNRASLISEARSFLRPIDWRGEEPNERDLSGCLLFDRSRRTTSFDGTTIAYDVQGEQGPWVVLVPGFCCPDNFWRYLLPALRERYRVIVYDLRGLGLSGAPRAPGYRGRNLTPEDFSIPNHVRDIEAILLPRPVVLLWRSALLADPALTHQIAQLSRALGPDAKLEDMQSSYRHLAYLDPLVVLKMAESVRAHSASAILPTVRCRR